MFNITDSPVQQARLQCDRATVPMSPLLGTTRQELWYKPAWTFSLHLLCISHKLRFICRWLFLVKSGQLDFFFAIKPVFSIVEWKLKSPCIGLVVEKLGKLLDSTYPMGKLPLRKKIWFSQYFVTFRELFFCPKNAFCVQIKPWLWLEKNTLKNCYHILKIEENLCI